MTRSAMEMLASIAVQRDFKKNENIFLLGQEARYVYQVITGKVHLYRYTAAGHRILLHTALDGDFFAEASLNSDEYHCTATCIEDTQVLYYESLKIMELLLGDKDFSMNWIARLSSEVRRQRAIVERLHLKSPIDRLTHYLVTQGDTDGKVAVDGTLSDLAESLNLSRETLYRILAEMEKKGVLERGRDYLKLLDTV